MGRKLNTFEEASLLSSEAEASTQDRTRLSRSQNIRHRIAEQLGISVIDLRNPSETSNAVYSTNNPVQSNDAALTRECLELLDAYIQITDPAQRRRCLQTIREAADGSADISSATKG